MFRLESSLDKCLHLFILVNPVDGRGCQEAEIQEQPRQQGFLSSEGDSQQPVTESEHKRGGEGDETSGDGHIVLRVLSNPIKHGQFDSKKKNLI